MLRARQEGTRRTAAILLVTVCAVFAPPCLAQPNASDPLTPENVTRVIGEQGAAKAFKTFASDQALFDDLLMQISSGNAEWLSIAVRLAPAFKGYDERRFDEWRFNGALSGALEAAAEAVLEFVQKGALSTKDVCGFNPLAFNRAWDKGWLRAVLKPREDAVSAVDKPDLAATKAECLSEVQKLTSPR